MRGIDCDDQGAYYVEAKANNCKSLTDFLTMPNLPISFMNKFILDEHAPWEGNIKDTGGRVLRIQATFFPCGGIVIGILVSHVVTDGVGFSAFLKDWATTAATIRPSNLRRLDATAATTTTICPCPIFDASSLFPAIEDYPTLTGLLSFLVLKTGRTTMRRFLFDGPTLSTLKARASTSAVLNPSRVEVVSALIWSCLIRLKRNSNRVAIKHAVNIRPKTEPPFPQHTVGNLFLVTRTAPSKLQEDTELQGLVFELRKSFKRISSDVVKKLQGCGGFSKLSEFYNQVNADGEAVYAVTFSSWCNFGIYQLDFGWGNPDWAGVAGLGNEPSRVKDIVILMGTKSGDGVEAWVNIREEDMALLENDPELLAFAHKDPSPLRI